MKRTIFAVPFLLLVLLLSCSPDTSAILTATKETPAASETSIEKAALPTTQTHHLPPPDAFMKGFAFADWNAQDKPRPLAGPLYNPDYADTALKALANTGTTWISLVVQVWQKDIASTNLTRNQFNTPSDAALRHIIELAHSLGIRVLITPYIGLSSDPRHALIAAGIPFKTDPMCQPINVGMTFTGEDQWQAWFASYGDIVKHYATFAQEAGADMFSIGHELGITTNREKDWRRIMITFSNIKKGILKVTLEIDQLYSTSINRSKFEERLDQFLSCDNTLPKIFTREGVSLIYRTEQIIPEKQDSRPPVLLLFGNPAPQSVIAEMFFAFENNRTKHRLWNVLNKTDILIFTSNNKSISVDNIDERNQVHKRELYELSYISPFRVGFAVFFSMPTPASNSKWSGVQGLYRLFGKEVVHKIAVYEKNRVNALIRDFVSPYGSIIAFQKNAYMGVKSFASPAYEASKAKEGKLIGNCECDSNIRLFCSPPTRLIQAKKSIGVLDGFRQAIMSTSPCK